MLFFVEKSRENKQLTKLEAKTKEKNSFLEEIMFYIYIFEA